MREFDSNLNEFGEDAMVRIMSVESDVTEGRAGVLRQGGKRMLLMKEASWV